MHSNENWVLQVDPAVLKATHKIPRRDAERILFAMRRKQTNPYWGDMKKMRGEKGVWRERVGAYRIFYEIIQDEKIVHVVHLERRTSKTY